jgi:hypothetical protein
MAIPPNIVRTKPSAILPSVWMKYARWTLVFAFMLLSLLESTWQVLDNRYVGKVAEKAVQGIDSADTRSRVIALRDYLRSNVTSSEAPYEQRPFLRATAADTLRSGKGYCGEVSRALICMARVFGIPAQRINLQGARPHVVAEVEVAPGKRLIVDCQNPPSIAGLESLDRVILRPEYDDYYTLNLRRLRVEWLVSRIKLQMGPLTYWTENPHALKALFWFSIALSLLALAGVRHIVRWCLRRRGWIHISSVAESETAPKNELPESVLPVVDGNYSNS